MNRAFYGDIHGCFDELEELYRLVEKKHPGIEHWHLGDLVDRGPDSGKVIDFCMEKFTGGVKGNHEDTIVKSYYANKKREARGETTKAHPNKDKAKTLSQLTDLKAKYIGSLPHLHVFDDSRLIIVHGGLLPYRPLEAQIPEICIRAQMIKPMDPKAYNRWWGGDSIHQPKTGKTEEESRAEGYLRWYEAYDHEYDCIYGHSVMGLDPYVHQREGYGKTIGIDTGSCFGGFLTAYIHPLHEAIKVQCKEYVEGKNIRSFKGMI
jgi:hypothetical protein